MTPEDPDVKQSGEAERRRIAAMFSRSKTRASRDPQGYKTIFGA